MAGRIPQSVHHEYELIHDESGHTMVFAVPSHSQSTSFDSGKAQPNGFPQSRSVDVRNPVLVADAAVGEIEALAGHIAIGVRCIVRGEPRTK